jgi:hypothetical protein
MGISYADAGRLSNKARRAAGIQRTKCAHIMRVMAQL